MHMTRKAREKRERERDQKIPRLSYEGILGDWFM